MTTPEHRHQPAEAPITAHLNTYLGQVKEGWRPGGSNPEGGEIALVRWSLEPQWQWTTIGTYGLSRLPLTQDSGAELRQELLICWPDEKMGDTLLAHLYAVAQTMAVTGETLGRGVLLPLPAEPVLESGGPEPFAAWFANVPYFLPRDGVLLETVEPPLMLTWLIPVYQAEADFILQQGVEAFEDKLLASGEACFSWPRKPLV